jgi:hypothetical protein
MDIAFGTVRQCIQVVHIFSSPWHSVNYIKALGRDTVVILAVTVKASLVVGRMATSTEMLVAGV